MGVGGWVAGWVGGWLGISKIKPTQPQLGLAGAWAELGKITITEAASQLQNCPRTVKHLKSLRQHLNSEAHLKL